MKKLYRTFALLGALLCVSLTGCQTPDPEPNPPVPPPEEEQIDMEKFPNYVKDIDKLEYSFGDGETRDPFWKGNVIYNETVLLIDAGSGAVGNLLFPAVRIVSVRDYTLKTEYEEGVDFTVEGNVVKRTENSSIPFLTEANTRGEDIPEPYRKVDSISNILTDYTLMGANVVYTESPLFYGNQLSVTYVYDVTKVDFSAYPTYDGESLPKLTAKLKAKQSVKLAALGDSVLEGCSSSGQFHRPPYMDNFIELTRKGLADLCGGEVTLDNFSVGGMTSAWGTGTAQIKKIVDAAPDVLFLHFGINDCGAGTSPNMYEDNIKSIILSVRQSLPDCEIVFLTPFQPNQGAYDLYKFDNYWKRVNAFIEKQEGIKLIDVYKLSQEILKVKSFQDVTGNGINHVNDYSSRLYLMSILSTLVEY